MIQAMTMHNVKTIPILAAAIFIFGAGAASAQGAGESKSLPALPAPSDQAVRNAQNSVTVADGTVGLSAHVWQNIMPGPGPRTGYLHVVASLEVAGSISPGDLTLTGLWLVTPAQILMPFMHLQIGKTGNGVRALGYVEWTGAVSGNFSTLARFETASGTTEYLVRTVAMQIPQVQ